MNRIVKAYFIDSADPDYEADYDDVILLAPDLTLQIDSGDKEWIFRSATNENGTIVVDIDTCDRVILGVMDLDIDMELPADFLVEASFVDVIKALMKNKEDL